MFEVGNKGGLWASVLAGLVLSEILVSLRKARPPRRDISLNSSITGQWDGTLVLLWDMQFLLLDAYDRRGMGTSKAELTNDSTHKSPGHLPFFHPLPACTEVGQLVVNVRGTNWEHTLPEVPPCPRLRLRLGW